MGESKDETIKTNFPQINFIFSCDIFIKENFLHYLQTI